MKGHRSRRPMTPELQHVVPCCALPAAAAAALLLLLLLLLPLLLRLFRYRQLGGERPSGAPSRPQAGEPPALRRVLGSGAGGRRSVVQRADGRAAEFDGAEVHTLSPAKVHTGTRANTHTHTHTRTHARTHTASMKGNPCGPPDMAHRILLHVFPTMYLFIDSRLMLKC